MIATLNVWIRNKNCEIVKHKAHLHVYNCHRTQVLGAELEEGHIELRVPPGCYIINAGVRGLANSNVYTDNAMVIVRCGDDACVNLVLNDFREIEPVQRMPLIARGCGARILLPLIVNANLPEVKIDPEKLQIAIEVICKAANIEPKGLVSNLDDHEKEVAKFVRK
jgi:hypothetical protein